MKSARFQRSAWARWAMTGRPLSASRVPGTPRLAWFNTQVLPGTANPAKTRIWRVRGSTLFATCGTGYSFVPVRFGYPPEVVAQTAVNGTPRGDDLTGTTAADLINGRGGNDRITGRAGDDHLNGGRGNDTIFGDAGRDVVTGGAGNDTLLGGAGNDRISGGPGSDTIAAGLGKDLVRARDGAVDHITCGPGRDRVIADPQDDVAGDCEVVHRG